MAWRSVWLSVAAMFNGNYDLALCVSFFPIPESFGRFAQWIVSIDDGQDFSRFQKIFQKCQILRAHLRDEETRLFGPDPRKEWRQQNRLKH